MVLKILKWSLGIFFILGGIGFIMEGTIVTGILVLAIALVILFPKSHLGNKFYDKLKFRIILSVGLFIGSIIASPTTEKKIETQNSLKLESSSIAETAATVSEIPTEITTERLTEPITEKLTDPPTENPTEKPTEEPTETFTEPITDEPTEEETEPKIITHDYIINYNTGKFHKPTCYTIDDSDNIGTYTGSKDELINQGYVACKKCKP